MVREVDLPAYLPPFIADYKEINATLTAENPEFTLVWEAADRVLKNVFIATADEYGISRLEKMMKILPSADDSLEVRRARVQSRWFTMLPYTIRALAAKLGSLLGDSQNFSIWADFTEAYQLIVSVYLTASSQAEELEHLISTIVPMNIETGLIYESAHVGMAYYGTVLGEADIIELKQRKVV